jgi:hypothetical protein
MIVGICCILLFGYAINFDVRDLRAGMVDEAQTSRGRWWRRWWRRRYQARVHTDRLPSSGACGGRHQGWRDYSGDLERRLLDQDRPAAVAD